MNTGNWVESFPFILLGIRNLFKEDISATAAGIYKELLHIPGEFSSAPMNECITENLIGLLKSDSLKLPYKI